MSKKKPQPEKPPEPRELNLLASAVELEAAAPEGEPNKLRRFSMTAYTGGPMQLAGWRYPVVVDLQGLNVGGQKRPILLDHTRDVDFVMGQTDGVSVVNNQLVVAGHVMGESTKAKQVIALNDKGFAWQSSIGARADQVEFVPEGKTSQANGREFAGPVNIARRATLGEISFVVLGADDSTSAQIAASAHSTKEIDMEFATWIEAQGFTPDALNDAQTKNLRALYDVQAAKPTTTAEPPPNATVQIRAEAIAELERINAIRKACDGRHPEIEAQAIKEGWDGTKTELAVLRASRPSGPAIHIGGGDGAPVASQIIEAALCMQAGVPCEERFPEQTLERATKYRRRGLRWCAEQICASHGRVIDADPGTTEWIRAAFSTSELSGIVGNVANKALQAAFTAAPSVADRIAASKSHANFHAHTVYSLALNGELQPVGADGELKHLSISEESRTRQLDTRGALLSITRKDLINDDLGAFADNAMALGRKSLHSREKALFTSLNATGAGASFFTTARGNYFEGAATPLSLASISTAVQMFRDLKGPDGDPIMVEPRLLLVPTALETTAREVMASQFVLGPTTAKTPAVNIWQNAFTPVTSPWLSNTNLSGASSAAWYLLADPADMAALEIAYLNGQQTPTVEFFGLDADPNVLGVTWRVYWDFGVALGEYRAGVKSKGAA
ncbi:MAG: Mu-like prophage major head subunit gpT family protein [Pirellulales bacterium]